MYLQSWHLSLLFFLGFLEPQVATSQKTPFGTRTSANLWLLKNTMTTWVSKLKSYEIKSDFCSIFKSASISKLTETVLVHLIYNHKVADIRQRGLFCEVTTRGPQKPG